MSLPMSQSAASPVAAPAAPLAHGAVPYVPPLALGQIVATPGALDALAEARANGAGLLARHARGDWGDVGPHDAAANRRAVLAGDVEPAVVEQPSED